MSHFLRYAGAQVGHDLATRCGSMEEFKALLGGLSGTCETGAVLGWRLLVEEMPTARLVVVKRSPVEVWQSLMQFGIDADIDDLMLKWELLGLVERLPGVLTVDYHSLREPEVCRAVFEYCLDLPFDWQWWEELNKVNIQVDMGLRLEQLIANRPRIERFKAEVVARTGALGNHHQCLN